MTENSITSTKQSPPNFPLLGELPSSLAGYATVLTQLQLTPELERAAQEVLTDPILMRILVERVHELLRADLRLQGERLGFTGGRIR